MTTPQPTWLELWRAILGYGALKGEATRILYADHDEAGFHIAAQAAEDKETEIGDLLMVYVATHVPTEQVMTDWVGERDTDAPVSVCRALSEELGVVLGTDTSVVPATTFGKHFTRGTRRKKDELDREVGR